jgi:hypothetical protein
MDAFGITTRRIDNPEDWVRKEVETALGDTQKLVIPILINEAKLPPQSALPKELHPLLACQHKQIREANWDDDLLPLVKRIREHLGLVPPSDNPPPAPKTVFVPPHKSLTCDRVPQCGEFDEVYYTEQREKITFFYLVGDARQAHISLPNRFGHRVSGQHFDPDIDKALPEGRKWVFKRLKPEPASQPNATSRQLNLLREVFSKFYASPPGRGLLQQTLAHLCDRSFLQHFTAEDSVFVLITLDKRLWHPVYTPAVVRQFIEGFCRSVPMPDDAPDFFFFFGIEYPQTDDEVKTELKAAIENRSHGHPLSDLEPVPLGEVAEWFTRHEALIPDGKIADDMPGLLFPGENIKDMLDIERQLRAIINLHNKGHVRGPKT